MDESQRERLHLALEGDLQARHRLPELLQDPTLRAAHDRLAGVQQALGGLGEHPPPISVAPLVWQDIRTARLLDVLPPPSPLPEGFAANLAARIAAEGAGARLERQLRELPSIQPPRFAPQLSARIARESQRNPAALVLVSLLLASLAALTVRYAWPNLQASAVAVRALLSQLSPLVLVGFTLLLVASALLSVRPGARVQRWGGLAYALAALLIVPGLWNLFGGGGGLDRVRVGGDIRVAGRVAGDVIALGGNVTLTPQARVGGEVIAFLGDVQRAPGAQVRGSTSALLGRVADGNLPSVQTQPLRELGTASAFLPLLQLVGGSTWPRIYVAALLALTLLLGLSGAARRLSLRQRRDPLRTLALGSLLFGPLVAVLMLLALGGLLAPAAAGALAVLLAFSVGLSVSLQDAGRWLARRLGLPHVEVVGAALGLTAFGASLEWAPLALSLWLLGGVWGAGTLLLRRPWQARAEGLAA